MAVAFPIIVKGVESLTVKRNEFQTFDFAKDDFLFRGMCWCQLITMGLMLLIQLTTLGSMYYEVVACEAWLNIFYLIGCIAGLTLILYPTNTTVACYIGMEGLVGLTAILKAMSDPDVFKKELMSPTSQYTQTALLLWTILAACNAIVLLTSALLLYQYLAHITRSSRSKDPQSNSQP